MERFLRFGFRLEGNQTLLEIGTYYGYPYGYYGYRYRPYGYYGHRHYRYGHWARHAYRRWH